MDCSAWGGGEGEVGGGGKEGGGGEEVGGGGKEGGEEEEELPRTLCLVGHMYA